MEGGLGGEVCRDVSIAYLKEGQYLEERRGGGASGWAQMTSSSIIKLSIFISMN